MYLNIQIEDEKQPPSKDMPRTWPPSSDTPMIIDHNGSVVSYYDQPTWDLTLWAGVKRTLDFGDGKIRSRIINTKVNANWYRRLTAWWIWRARSRMSTSTLKSYHGEVAKFFMICSLNGISVSDLHKFPLITENIITVLRPRSRERLINILHVIYENRGEIGFFILPPNDINSLKNYGKPSFTSCQTAYIPPRIWKYQVQRLKSFLDDYLAVMNDFEKLHDECLQTYIDFFGSIDGAFAPRKKRNRDDSPFTDESIKTFLNLANKHGLTATLKKWLLSPDAELKGPGRSVVLLSAYTTLATRVGIAFLLNFTTMRIDEAWKLRYDCLKKETDLVFGDFWTITGATTKTMQDSDARWVTSPSSVTAIQVLQHVAKLRMKSAALDPLVDISEEFIKNPFLVNRNYDPWCCRRYPMLPLEIRPHYAAYAAMLREYPNLYDPKETIITPEDLETTRLITPTLDLKKFVAGRPWPFCWHQTRRTGAVNMRASHLVSEASLQFNLKHQTRIQSLFYGQGHSHLIFNEEAKNEYVKAFYDVRAIEMDALLSNRFSSPHSQKRKDVMLKALNNNDLKSLRSFRHVFLGVCLNDQHCPYGGIDHISHCGGGKGRRPCSELLYDSSKLDLITELKADIQFRQESAPDDGPYADSLRAQLESAESAIKYIITLR